MRRGRAARRRQETQSSNQIAQRPTGSTADNIITERYRQAGLNRNRSAVYVLDEVTSYDQSTEDISGDEIDSSISEEGYDSPAGWWESGRGESLGRTRDGSPQVDARYSQASARADRAQTHEISSEYSGRDNSPLNSEFRSITKELLNISSDVAVNRSNLGDITEMVGVLNRTMRNSRTERRSDLKTLTDILSNQQNMINSTNDMLLQIDAKLERLEKLLVL